MKLDLHIAVTKSSKHNPGLIEQIGIKDLEAEDIAHFTVTDNVILLENNDGSHDVIELRDNDGKDSGDWRAINVFVTRKFLKVDMSQ